MNYAHFSSLGYTKHNYYGHRIVNPSKQFSGKKESYTSDISSSNVKIYDIEGDTTSFENYLHDHPISFVWFFAEWCGHCTVMKNDFEIAADKLSNRVHFIKVDAEKYKELSIKYNIDSYPTLMLFRDGVAVKNYEGPRNANAFVKWLQENI